ncbi:MAG TPA: hypothetical protein PKE00_00950 [Planctomycetota bacterium]|nr:hypothetical protein [Planctomycetota bacterium]
MRSKSPRRESLSIRALLAVGTFLVAGAAQADPTLEHEADGPRVRRQVLVLASRLSHDRGSSRDDAVRDMLELPIEHLGLEVVPVDAKAERPSKTAWNDVAAVMTSFYYGDEAEPWVWDFLDEARRHAHVRFVHFGDFGPLDLDRARLAKWLRGFGLEHKDGWNGDPVQIEVQGEPGRETGYEGRQSRRSVHLGPASFDALNCVWLRTQDRSKGDVRTPIVTGPWGGIALLPWAFTPGGVHVDRRWHVDPFAFFAAALDRIGVPCADPNVYCGRRGFFFHVDGDGFESQSTVRVQGRDDLICGEVFANEVLARYDLPMTLSVIVASVTDDIRPEAPTHAMQVARRLFADPKVEIASHSVLHPLDWRRKWTKATPRRVVNWYDGLASYRHDMVSEVRESLRFFEDYLVPDGKACRLFFWSGMANPDEAALRAVRELGLLNINGGVARWDELHASVSFVQPRGRSVGDEYQVYCAAPNENVFDGFFSTMPGAFAHVDRTIERSGTGRILKPANVYGHFYSVERPPRLRALQQVLDRWGRRERTAAIYASDYVRAVLDARQRCHVEREPRGWRFSGFEACRTVRLDGDDRRIDWAASPGIVGERRIAGSRYFLLGGPCASLQFQAQSARDDATASSPHIEEASHILEDIERDARGVSFRSRSVAPRSIVCNGFAPGAVVDVVLDGHVESRRADATGRVTIEAPPGGDTRVEVRPP